MPANSDVVVSVPVLKSASFAGLVGSVGANTVTVNTTPAFADNVWSATPHVLVIENGPKSGLIVPILSNLGNVLTIDPGVFSLTGIVAGNSLSIRPAWTLATFMSGATSLTGVQVFTFSNTQANINNSADGLYFYVGAGWENADGDPANDTILYPGDGFVVRTAATPIADFVVSGEVPKANSYVAIGESATGARDTMFSYVSPVSENLGVSGIGVTAGDVLLDFNNTAAGQNKSGTPYFYIGGGNWENGDGDSANTFPLEGGKAYVFRRATAAATGYIVEQDAQTYIPSL